uniref:CUB domain-containing protein n=1 Tax=Labrus bergylta TaxID=56723 RepID=A0A3Q3GXF2_9LABR
MFSVCYRSIFKCLDSIGIVQVIMMVCLLIPCVCLSSVVCGGTMNATTSEYGYLKSPGWPDIYPHNMDCTIVLKAPQNSYISFFFNNFDLESHTDCGFDYLEVRQTKHLQHLYDGPDSSSAPVGPYCGLVCNPRMPSHIKL